MLTGHGMISDSTISFIAPTYLSQTNFFARVEDTLYILNIYRILCTALNLIFIFFKWKISFYIFCHCPLVALFT